MVCCWVHSSVATTNEWINLSELHSALPIQRDQQSVPQREEKTCLFVTGFLSLSAAELYGLWFQTKNLWLSSVSQSAVFGFKKSSKTTHILKDYQAHFHQTLKTLTIQVEIHIRGLIRPFGRPCLSLIIAHLVGTTMPCEIKSLNVSGITICVVFVTGNSFILFSMIPRLMKCISLFIS